MTLFWKWLDNKDLKATQKFKASMAILGTIAGIIGLCVWLIIRTLILSTLDWMFIFIGYPVVLACLYSVIHAYRHDLHDGAADISEGTKEVQHHTVLRPGHVN